MTTTKFLFKTTFFKTGLLSYAGLFILIPLAISYASAEPKLPVEAFTFLTWSEYIDPELVQKFEHKFNAKINFVHYQTDDTRDKMMIESQGRGFDLILVSQLMQNQYKDSGWLDVIDYKQIPNSKHLHKRWLPKGQEQRYKIPYFWGTLGIAYRKDLVKEEITSWQQVFQADESLRGKILMLNNARDLTGVALKFLGYSANSKDLNQIKQAFTVLNTQKPLVKDYSYMTITEKSPLVTGAIFVAMAYNGDALTLKKHNSNIAYVLPEEGGLAWVDNLVIGQGSSHKQLVMKFINFINEPKNAARNARYVSFATPNKAAEQYLSQDFLKDPAIYPNSKDNEQLEYLDTIPINAQKLVNKIMLNLLRK